MAIVSNIITKSKYLEFADITVRRAFKDNRLLAKRVEFGPMSKNHCCWTPVDYDSKKDQIKAIETSFGKNGKASLVRIKIHEYNSRWKRAWSNWITPKKFKKIQRKPDITYWNIRDNFFDNRKMVIDEGTCADW